jgi:carbamoyltransferase
MGSITTYSKEKWEVYTLGIGDVSHDKSVCLMKNDKVIAAIEEERVIRVKHGLKLDPNKYTILEYGAHIHSLLDKPVVEREKNYLKYIDYCLKNYDIGFDDIDCIVTSSLFPNLPFRYKSAHIHHHIAHCASAFYPSSFDEAAILIIDGYGVHTDGKSETIMYAFGENNKITFLDVIEGYCDFTEEEKKQVSHRSHMIFKNSIGVFYQNITMLIGMGCFGEGKTMGLAPYGSDNPKLNKIREFIQFGSEGKLEIDNRSIFLYCKKLVEDAKESLDKKDKNQLFKFYADLAFKHQQLLEEMVLHLCHHLYAITECKSLCLAGGVALNSVANGKILPNTPFEKIFIQPAAGDNGISIGCALYGAHALQHIPRKYYKKVSFSPYLGNSYDAKQVENAVNQYKDKIIDHGYLENASKEAAQLISQGKIVAWYYGGCEKGPRALGNRSILADPRDPNMKNYLNQKVKRREFFRPYAPAVLEEKANEYFEVDFPCPYMLLVPMVKQDKQKLIPAVTHIDGTARLQTINEETNKPFYDIIKHFEEITGIPVILNTSFNGPGEPIIETPENAIKCFLNTGIDALFINGRLLTKQKLNEKNG